MPRHFHSALLNKIVHFFFSFIWHSELHCKKWRGGTGHLGYKGLSAKRVKAQDAVWVDCISQFSLVQSLDWWGHQVGHEGQFPEILFQSDLQEALASSSGMGRDVHSLMLSIQHFLCLPRRRPPSKVPRGMFLESLSRRVTRPNHTCLALKQTNWNWYHCFACPVKVGLLQELFVGHAKEPVTETKVSPEHCCKNCWSNSRIASHPFSVSYTGYLLWWELTTKSCLSWTAASMAQPLSIFRN